MTFDVLIVRPIDNNDLANTLLSRLSISSRDIL